MEKKYKVQQAHGAAVELHQFDRIVWEDLTYGGMTLRQALERLDDAVRVRLDSDDDNAAVYETVRAEINPANLDRLGRDISNYGELTFFADGREVAWRIAEDGDGAEPDGV